MILVQEEVVVVELHRIDAIEPLQHGKLRGSAFWSFSLLFAVEDGDDSAKLAPERASDASLVNRGPPPEKSGKQVTFNRSQTVVGERRKIAGRSQRAFGIVDMKSKAVFERKAVDAFEVVGPA